MLLGGGAKGLGQGVGVGDIGSQAQGAVGGLTGAGDARHPVALCQERLRNRLPIPREAPVNDDGTRYRRLGLFVHQHKHTR